MFLVTRHMLRAIICVDRENGLPVSNGCWQKPVVEHILQNMGILLSLMIRYMSVTV